MSLIDVRSRAAFVRAHAAGSASVPAPLLERRLFLLPPRDQALVVVSRDSPSARAATGLLSRRGWTRVAWLDGRVSDLPADLMRSGFEAVRLWRPARLLADFAALLPRGGAALDLACGSGRETVFLALCGLDALGVDLLPDALRQARILARSSGVQAGQPGRASLERWASRDPGGGRPGRPERRTPRGLGRAAFRRADLTDPRVVARLLRPGRWRAITCFRYLDRALLPRIAGALAPGGVLFYQTFLEAQARAGRKPKRAAFLLRPGELRRAFAGLEILHYAEGPDERGDHHASLVGRAPGPARR